MPVAYKERSLNLRAVFAHLLFISMTVPTTLALAASTNWQGPYVGAYVGGALGNNHTSTNTGSVTGSSYFTSAADINAVNSAGTSGNNSFTTNIGIQAGQNWLWKQMVYGVVADYGVLPLSTSESAHNKTYPSIANQYSVYTAMSTNWLFTLRGRVGYPTTLYWPRFSIREWPSLLYFTGGMALTQLKVNNSFSDNTSNAGTGGTSTAENKIGWTIGAGVELVSSSHTSVDIEYLYVHVPSVTTTSTVYNSTAGFGIPAHSLNSSFTTTGDFYASLLKVALNYRFNE